MKNQRLNKKKQVHQVFLQNNEMLKKSASVIVFVFVLIPSLATVFTFTP
jgi:hypothetical protein